MIWLTGDLHHTSLHTGNQLHCDKTEICVAQDYLGMLEASNVKVTFFISGRSFAEEWKDLKPICTHPLVEFGGHNYDCFQPELVHRVWNKLVGSYNGPKWVQRNDAMKTIRIIQKRTGKTVKLWRNHMYMHGPNTESVLSGCGIDLCTDGVKKHCCGPKPHEAGIYNFPINIIPDHEHLYHAERTPEWVENWVRRYNWSDDFGSDSYYINEWADLVIEQLEENERMGLISNMIIHPITMYLCDKFNAFSRVLDYLSTKETIHMEPRLAA